MAQLKERGLRRSVGVPGLFATAYGNVGSSIYYALGLVAAHALGLTPLVFIFAGGLFALTAKTYAEGASMFPEAGGSSSFARHAFNEVVSFFAGWGLSLDYIITVAISAFFVPHYLSAFFPALGHGPGRRDRRRPGDRDPRPAQHPRDRRVDAGEHLPRGHRPPDPDRARRPRRRPRARPRTAGQPGPPRASRPRYSQLLFAVSISMIAYTGIETVSNMAEEARDPGRGRAPHRQLRPDRGARDLRRDLDHLDVGAAGDQGRRRATTRPSSARPTRTIPCWGSSRPSTSRRGRDRSPLLHRHPRGDDPDHRHERGADRDLAPLLVARRAPPASRCLLPAPSPLPHARGSRSPSSR